MLSRLNRFFGIIFCLFLFFGVFLSSVYAEDAILFDADPSTWFKSDIEYKVLKNDQNKYDVYLGENKFSENKDSIDDALNSVREYYSKEAKDDGYVLNNFRAYSSEGFSTTSGRSGRKITTIDLEKRAYGFIVDNPVYADAYRQKFVDEVKVSSPESTIDTIERDDISEADIVDSEIVDSGGADSEDNVVRTRSLIVSESKAESETGAETETKTQSEAGTVVKAVVPKPSINAQTKEAVVSPSAKTVVPTKPTSTLECVKEKCSLSINDNPDKQEFKSKEEAVAFLISNVNNIDTTKTDSKVAELMNKVSEGDISTINDITKKLNSNDKNIFLEKLASGASSDYKNKLDNYKSGKNIDDMDKKELNFFIANVKLEKDDVKVYVNSLEMKSEDLAKYESGQNCNTEDDCKERIKEVKAEISNIENVLSGAKYDANALLLTLSPSEREAFLKNRKDAEHSSGWLGKIGSFFDFRSQQDIAVGIYLKSISDERDNLNNELFKVSGKFKTYNTEGAEDAVNTYNQNLISNAVAGNKYGITCDKGDFNECLGQVRDRIATCGEDEDCKADLRLVAARLEAGSEYEMIESGWTQSIISSILSPKASDMKAARFFGFEEDYTDVPTFLKESFPSQMCMGKIEGYLDKTETESGGLTKYGCDNEDYVSKYDEQTKKFEQVGNPNCIKVMVDLRAQRTQITPDEEVAISYSYFLRAPSGVDLRVILALTYMDNGVRKKDLLTEDIIKLTGGETKKGFDSVDFKINSSDISKVLDTSDSFYLGLLALDSSNRPVYSESVPIALITGGDSYSFDVFTPTGSGSESGTSQGSVANKELSASDMLDLI